MNALPFTLETVLVVSFLFTLAPHGPAAAQAPVRQVVPYSGHLDQGGQTFDGTAALRFRVYAQLVEGDVLWAEIHPAVNVRDGRFAVRLGEQPVPEGQTGIVELATAGHQLYLELSVALPEPEGVEPDWTQLAGRQALHPAPQALWTATGSDLVAQRVTAFEVDVTGRMFNSGDGPLAVNDSFFVNGDVRVAGALRVDGALGALARNGSADANQRGGGDANPVGPSASTHFCTLSKVIINRAPPGNPECDVFVHPDGRYRLRAVNAHCSMTCLRFRE